MRRATAQTPSAHGKLHTYEILARKEAQMTRVIFEGTTFRIREKNGDAITTDNGDQWALHSSSFSKPHKTDGHADPSVGDVFIFIGRPDPRMELAPGVTILVSVHRGCACDVSLRCTSLGPASL